jgi:hypothetical protein
LRLAWGFKSSGLIAFGGFKMKNCPLCNKALNVGVYSICDSTYRGYDFYHFVSKDDVANREIIISAPFFNCSLTDDMENLNANHLKKIEKELKEIVKLERKLKKLKAFV